MGTLLQKNRLLILLFWYTFGLGIPFFCCHGQDLGHPEKYVYLYDVAYRQPYPKRWNLIDSVRENTFTHLMSKEGYFFRLAVAELAAKQEDDEKALLLTKLYKMDYMQRVSKVLRAELDKWYNEAIAEADRVDFQAIKPSFSFLYAASLKSNYQQDVLALYFLHKAIEYAEAIEDYDSHQKGQLLSGVTRIFYQFDDFAKAVRYGKEVEKYPISNVEQFLTLDVVAMSYLKLKQYNLAKRYFDKTIRMFETDFSQAKDKQGWYGILMGSKGHVYKATGQLDSAIHCYQIGIEDTYKNNFLDNTCGFATALADLYLSQGKVAEAAKWIPLARQATHSQGNEFDKWQLYRLLSRYYTTSGVMASALQYRDSTQYWEEILQKRRGKNVQIQADLKLEMERRHNAEMTLSAAIEQQKINRIVTIIIIILVAGLAFVWILRQRLLIRFKENELKTQQQEAERRLLIQQETAKREQMLAELKLEEFTNIIVAKNKQIEMLQAQNERGVNDASIQQLQHNTLLTEEQWLSFKQLFEQVHGGYLQRLKEKIPGISPAEIRFMSLAKLKLDTKEMASSLGVSPNAVRNVWFRLRKKIDLPEEVTWNDFADRI